MPRNYILAIKFTVSYLNEVLFSRVLGESELLFLLLFLFLSIKRYSNN